MADRRTEGDSFDSGVSAVIIGVIGAAGITRKVPVTQIGLAI